MVRWGSAEVLRLRLVFALAAQRPILAQDDKAKAGPSTARAVSLCFPACFARDDKAKSRSFGSAQDDNTKCMDPSLRLVFTLGAQRTILAQDDTAEGNTTELRSPGSAPLPGRLAVFEAEG